MKKSKPSTRRPGRRPARPGRPRTPDRAETTDTLLHLILTNPTAPFREDAVLAAIDQFALERSDRIRLKIDAFGNRILTIVPAGGGAARPTMAFTAHLDHPGFVKNASGTYELLGRVWPVARLKGAPVCFYQQNGAFAGRGMVKSASEAGGSVQVSLSVNDSGEPHPPHDRGTYAMFDFPPLQYDGDRIVGRVCDDLLGAIAILITVEEIIATNPGASFIAAFTRAEEVGFVGALGMMTTSDIPREIPIVGLECSAARGGNAVVGAGPIVRVGDRMTTFDPGVSGFLYQCAQQLAAASPDFIYQRRLMQGGACESTAYLLAGRRAGALCLALGNYHNVPDPDPGDTTTGVAPEFVSRRDLNGLVTLMVHAVTQSSALKDPFARDRAALDRRLRELVGRLHELDRAPKKPRR